MLKCCKLAHESSYTVPECIRKRKSTMKPLFNRLFGGSERTAKVKRNAIGSLCIKGWSILVSFLLVPMTIDYLSEDLYGVWLAVSSMVVWLNFFDIGFTLGLKNKLAEALAKEDYKRGKTLVSTTYGMMLLIFVPLGLILEAVVPHVDWCGLLNVSPSLQGVLIAVMRILVLTFVLQMIFNTIVAVLAAHQRTAMSGVFPVIGHTLSAVVIFILTRTVPPSLYSFSLAISYLPVAVVIVASVILFRTSLRRVAPSPACFDRGCVRNLFKLGVKFFIIQIQLVVLYQTTNVLISNISSPEMVTTYNIAYKYLNVAPMVFFLIISPLWPAYTDAYTKGDFAWMRNIHHKMMRITLLIIIGLAVMTAVSPWVYRLWVGEDIAVPWIMTVSVSVYFAAYIWHNLQVWIINGIGAIKIQTYVILVGLFLHIPLSFFLGRYVGGVGVIWSMLVISLIYATVFTIQARKLLGGVRNTIWNQ